MLFALLVLPLGTWLSSIGSPAMYFSYDLPPGQLLYALAKLIGMYAFVLIWLQVMLGLLKGDPALRRFMPPLTTTRHRMLGIVTLLTAWTHFLLFFSAVSVRNGEFAYSLLLPAFDNGIYFIAVSLGWFAVITMTLVAITGLLRRRSGGIWAFAHRLSIAVFAVALIHAQMIGSEAKSGLWFALHLCFAGAVLVALARRFTLRPQPR
jgi:predicted ferric reductase